ncbi:oxidoreductase [Mangrovivirga cuniculi]|uniref:Short-chain dehydrogenase n=1 Tax=Mangrovivirga cuniculi TaxID=2715131 RepID=A0A4D7JVK5_9BACT|nr:oxidoreductase [Mangrovivirga cuniculi]QCK16572.1 short-chain dehydrogenase [Mangrovivirga cuniculi]
MADNYSFKNISLQKGKIAIVTGANVGLGKETCSFFLEKKIKVIMACRNPEKAEKAKEELQKRHSDGEIEIMEIDLADLDSVSSFTRSFHLKYDRLDFLINNAGVMFPPYQTTVQGFELQFGVNYLAHFKLTSLLYDLLSKTEGSRVVTLSSLAHAWGDIYFDDLNFLRGYDKRKAYSQSKLACLMFAYELQRRIDKKGNLSPSSLAAHPGISSTNLGRHLPGFVQSVFNTIGPVVFNSSRQGAEPIVRAALDPNGKGGEYYGPSGLKEYSGKPVKVDSNDISKDKFKANRLWDVSEQLTNTSFKP